MALYKITDLHAWSDGQVRSKMWLLDYLVDIINREFNHPVTIWQLAGWYAQLAFMLQFRIDDKINKFRSFDVDTECEAISEAINNRWLINEWKFKALTEDINNIDYTNPWKYHSPEPDIIINTSCEHIDGDNWFNNIPGGKLIILQSTDMKHSDHFFTINSVDELKMQFKLSYYIFADTLNIQYREWSFKRFMTIGFK